MQKITDRKIVIILGLLTLVVYLLSSHGEGKYWNYFVLLADAFLHGRLNVIDHPDWLNELIVWQGKYYVVYPPMPGVLLMPFVAIFGKNFPQPILSILLGAVNVSLSYLVFIKFFQKKSTALWISFLYAFGTMQWYHAGVGSAWYIAHIIAVFFIWLTILEIMTKQRLYLIGLFIGAAYLSRLPTILAVVFPLIYLSNKFFNFENKKFKGVNFKSFLILGLGVLPLISSNFLYNYLRFNTIFDIAYQLLPIFNEPWYKYGLFSVKYIPIHLKEMFTAMPKFTTNFPFIIPSFNAMALWFVTPAFVLILFAKFKERLVFSSFITVIIMALPSLTHGSNGFSQFGFRFALDYTPFLLLIIASVINGHIKWWMKALIMLSIAVNLWGVIMISFLNIWIM